MVAFGGEHETSTLSLTCPAFTSFTVRHRPQLKKLPRERGKKTRRRRRRRVRTGMGRLFRKMLCPAAVARL